MRLLQTILDLSQVFNIIFHIGKLCYILDRCKHRCSVQAA